MTSQANYQCVNDDQTLATLCQQWMQETFLAVDTEFVRTKTFYPRLGLLQVADAADRCYLIDPLSIQDMSPFKAVLENPDVIKVLHAGSEDVEIFFCILGARCQSLYDSQIAAAYLGFGISIGYANLVKQELGVELPKDETRSDWLERPLTDSQKSYAALDVEYLYQLYERQKTELVTQQRFEWVMEDSDRLVEANLPQDPELYYLKIRQAWQLKGARLWVLKELAAWREKTAKEKDIPRSRVLRDALIYEIAAAMPGNLNQLDKIRGLYPGFTRRYGNIILEIVAKSSDISRSDFPTRIPGPLKIEAGQVLKQARELVNQLGEELQLPPELLARRKQLEAVISSGLYSGEFELDSQFSGWRRERIGEPLLALLQHARGEL